jgi:hypothetical protein
MSSGTKIMRMQENPDGLFGHEERARMKQMERFDESYNKTNHGMSTRLCHEPMPILCPVYKDGCQLNQCPCKRRKKYDVENTGFDRLEFIIKRDW